MSRRNTRRRARRFILRGYYRETSEAVQASLDRNDAEDLAETVRLAERGDSIADLSVCQDRDERAASAMPALIDNPDVPEFLTQAVRDALDLAYKITGIDYKDVRTGD